MGLAVGSSKKISPEALPSQDGNVADILKENNADIGMLKEPLWLTACVNLCELLPVLERHHVSVPLFYLGGWRDLV